jgi:hypothetical protein
MGGIAGPILLLLVMTVFSNAVAGMTDLAKETTLTVGLVQMIVIIGILAGFAERLVPNLVQDAADKIQTRAGTPGQASQGMPAGGNTGSVGQTNPQPKTDPRKMAATEKVPEGAVA